MQNNKKLFLVDGMALIYRAHFAMAKNPLTSSSGINTSAIYGFINSSAVFESGNKLSPFLIQMVI